MLRIARISPVRLFVAASFIIVGIAFVLGAIFMPSSEVEVSVPFPISIIAEVKDGRMVVRGTDADAWLVELSLGLALIVVGISLTLPSMI